MTIAVRMLTKIVGAFRATPRDALRASRQGNVCAARVTVGAV
jgi:hypothetical protein